LNAASITARLAPRSITQFSFMGPQSVTDYPLRNQTMLALAAFALLLLTRIATGRKEAGA
jgi:hypothetical protein